MTAKELKRYIPYLAAVLAAGFIRLFAQNFHLPYHGILSMIYICIYSMWCGAVQRRFTHKDIRGMLGAAGVMSIFLIITRMIKYEFVSSGTVINRLLWYSYYIPFTVIPVLMLLAVLRIGKAENEDIPKSWYLLFVPAAVIITGIMTNDLHEQAFLFTDDATDSYTYGFLYYAVYAFIIIMLAGVITVLIKNGSSKRFIGRLWLPLTVLGFGGVYTMLYPYRTALREMYEFPEMISLVMIGFLESLILTRMIPSNTDHGNFFRSSSINAGLADRYGNVKLRSSENVALAREDILSAVIEPVLLPDSAKLLKCKAVSGGYFYWIEDISEMLRLNAELENTGDYLTEEQAMLEESARIKEKRKRIAEQNILYDKIALSLRPELERLSDILDDLPVDEREFCTQMKLAAFLNAYVKRRSNLLLIADAKSDDFIDSGELAVSVAETLEYLKLRDIGCFSDIASGIPLAANIVLFMFGLFENAAEICYNELNAVLVTLRRNTSGIVFCVELGLPELHSVFTFPDTDIPPDCRLFTDMSEDCWRLTLTIPAGGDMK